MHSVKWKSVPTVTLHVIIIWRYEWFGLYVHWGITNSEKLTPHVLTVTGMNYWRPFRFSEPPYIIVTMARCVRGGSQWDQLNLTVTSLCVSCRSHCYLFACYYYFMSRLCILCYLCRTIALVATVICWLYPTLNKFYLILSYLIFLNKWLM